MMPMAGMEGDLSAEHGKNGPWSPWGFYNADGAGEAEPESPSKALPTKMMRQQRLRDQRRSPPCRARPAAAPSNVANSMLSNAANSLLSNATNSTHSNAANTVHCNVANSLHSDTANSLYSKSSNSMHNTASNNLHCSTAYSLHSSTITSMHNIATSSLHSNAANIVPSNGTGLHIDVNAATRHNSMTQDITDTWCRENVAISPRVNDVITSPRDVMTSAYHGVLDAGSERKCTGTQTSFLYPNTAPAHTPPHRRHTPSPHGTTPPHSVDLTGEGGAEPPTYHLMDLAPPGYQHPSPAHTPPQQSPHRPADSDTAPLNLSRRPSPPPAHAHYSEAAKRQDVTQRHHDATQRQVEAAQQRHERATTCHADVVTSQPLRRQLSGSGEQHEASIEEHFRRSLGVEYPRLVSSGPPSPEPGPTLTPLVPAHNQAQHVSVTGAVDDHFAKSLGATWAHLKAAQASTLERDSVDEHFAKALGGDTWRKIKENRLVTSHHDAVTLRRDDASLTSSPRGSPPSQVLTL